MYLWHRWFLSNKQVLQHRLHGWPQSAPPSNEAPSLEAHRNFSNLNLRFLLSFAYNDHCSLQQNDDIFFTIPGFERALTGHAAQLTRRVVCRPTWCFPTPGSRNPGLNSWPLGNIDLGVGNYPPRMCGCSTQSWRRSSHDHGQSYGGRVVACYQHAYDTSSAG